MDQIEFLVQGSAAEPYQVTFIRRDKNNLSAYCTCPAGEKGIYCKHRIRIFAGETENIVSGNTTDVKTLRSWLPGTDVEKAIIEVVQAQQVVELAEQALRDAKKTFAARLRD